MSATDLSMANAALTELQDPPLDAQITNANGFSSSATPQPDETASVPAQSIVSNGAANAAAQLNLDSQMSSSVAPSATGDEWVDVQTPQKSPPATLQSSNSWAEDVPLTPANDESEQYDGSSR